GGRPDRAGRRAAPRRRDRAGRLGRAGRARGRRPPLRSGRRGRLRRARNAAVDPMSGPVRVLIVDDDALVRSGLRMMLAGAESLRVVGEVDDGSRVLTAVDLHNPDVVLMDIRMPELDAIASTRLLR